ncbi:ABC transporter substrate-binding protein [Roseibium salinum]|uniref:ABC transporter substrate-binding protein n=1 Tax=Roseibium salinum TaxID=1604349 RepID=A0ABT3R7W6_9HYPH|nr:ABC transporter substrate-binding protein [Roseibium sp. DSM 29163]MCX2725224.1 ABC transporter substrate-binding protein [Roseibium sp. DSM 29163]
MTSLRSGVGALLTATALATSVSAAQSADLRMSWWGGDSRHQATQEALKVCGEKHGHTIKPEFTGWSGHLEKVTTQIAGGTEADIMQINWPWLPLFSANGEGFADLSGLSNVIELDNWTDAQLASTSVNGHLNGLPVSTTGRVFFFNKTTFDKAGVEIPVTWDDLFTAAQQIREKLGEDYYPLNAIQETAALLVSLRVTQQTGKDLIDPETMTVAWTPEELAKGIEFYGKMMESGVTMTQKKANAAGNAELYEKPEWTDGRIAGSYEWDSTYFKYSDPLEVGQHLVPTEILTGEDAVTEGIYRKPSMMFSISKRSENPEAAAQILNCLLNEPEGIEALGTTRGLPASKAAADQLKEAGSIKPELAQANAIIMAASGPTVSPLNEHPDVRTIFLDTLEVYAYGQIDAATAAEEIIAGINEAIEEYKP